MTHGNPSKTPNDHSGESTASKSNSAAEPEDDARQPTMGEISHTNPYTGRAAGQLFTRGPIVVADGGERAETGDADSEADGDDSEVDGGDGVEERNEETRSTDERRAESSEPSTRMRDVDHTPPKNAAGANRVFERGHPSHEPVTEE